MLRGATYIRQEKIFNGSLGAEKKIELWISRWRAKVRDLAGENPPSHIDTACELVKLRYNGAVNIAMLGYRALVLMKLVASLQGCNVLPDEEDPTWHSYLQDQFQARVFHVPSKAQLVLAWHCPLADAELTINGLRDGAITHRDANSAIMRVNIRKYL